jgi:hypothetical protein
MRVYQFHEDPRPTYLMLASDLLEAPIIHTGEWQAMDTSASPAHKTHELEDVTLRWDEIPQTAGGVHNIIPAIDQPWATAHFEERVSGIPWNPAPSHLSWPYAVGGNGRHMAANQFDHTYPERFWAHHAGAGVGRDKKTWGITGNVGIRFQYGDLNDVVDLLVRAPLTRQAYLPIWFPEDTGAVEGQRVPCTLGYHFMQRHGRLSVRYYMRSCDVYRHLSNDVFFAAALTHWICNKLAERTADNQMKLKVRPGSLTMHISSLHAFVGDTAKIQARIEAVSAA